jgi:hypothetical protein
VFGNGDALVQHHVSRARYTAGARRTTLTDPFSRYLPRMPLLRAEPLGTKLSACVDQWLARSWQYAGTRRRP